MNPSFNDNEHASYGARNFMENSSGDVNSRLAALAQSSNASDPGMNYQNFGKQGKSNTPQEINQMMISEMLKQQRNLQSTLSNNSNGFRGYPDPNTFNSARNVLLVENLPNYMASMGSVCDLFGSFGMVEDVKILERKQYVALVQMKTPEMAQMALLRQNDFRNINPALNVNLCTDIESVVASCSLPAMAGGSLGSRNEGLARGMDRRRFEEDSMGPGRVILINDMPMEMANPKEVFNLFSIYAEVTKVQVLEKQPTKALVETANPAHADACRRNLHGLEICGSKISISASNKSYLGGHIDDPFYEEFRRNRRGDRVSPSPPSPVLFITNTFTDDVDELKRYIVESGYTVLDISKCGKSGESALVKMPSVSEAAIALIKLQDTMPQNHSRKPGKGTHLSGLNIMFSHRNELVSKCFVCNEPGHLSKDCPTDSAKRPKREHSGV